MGCFVQPFNNVEKWGGIEVIYHKIYPRTGNLINELFMTLDDFKKLVKDYKYIRIIINHYHDGAWGTVLPRFNASSDGASNHIGDAWFLPTSVFVGVLEKLRPAGSTAEAGFDVPGNVGAVDTWVATYGNNSYLYYTVSAKDGFPAKSFYTWFQIPSGQSNLYLTILGIK